MNLRIVSSPQVFEQSLFLFFFPANLDAGAQGEGQRGDEQEGGEEGEEEGAQAGALRIGWKGKREKYIVKKIRKIEKYFVLIQHLHGSKN